MLSAKYNVQSGSKHFVKCHACNMTGNSSQCKHLTGEDACNLENEVSGRAKGGMIRAELLSPEERRLIAKKGAAARWGVRAIKKGNFQEQFGIDVDCYVLDDEQKTPVVSKRGMGQAIGLSKRGDRLSGFVYSQTMNDHIGRELRQKIENPIVFQPFRSAAGNAISEKAFGYDATILIDLCKAILVAHADGKLAAARYEKMVRQAQIVLTASAKSGIRGLIYALAGYTPTTEEVIQAFKLYVQEEARKYAPEFPNELYMQWHRLYEIPIHERGKPWHFKYLTVRDIYHPLARSYGKIYMLLKALKAQDGDRQKKLFQFLNEIGARALRIHLGRVLEMAESSANKYEYERKITQRFGGQLELEFMMPVPSNASPLHSGQSPSGVS